MNDVLLLLIGLAGLALIIWPRVGLWSRWRQARGLAGRARREDALKHILKSEVNGQEATVLSVAGALRVGDNAAAALLRDLEAHGLITFEAGRLQLLRPGRELAVQVVRAHRLWESHLAEETGVAEARWHRLAERQEHLLSPQATEALAARLGHPLLDPHGDSIPDPGLELPADAGQSINAMAPDQVFTIVHLEDEPEALYAQLLGLGLRAGMRGYVVAKTKDRLQVWAEGRAFEIAPSLAQNVSVAPLPGVSSGRLRAESSLHELPAGRAGRVLGLSAACRGAERRRLLDLGFVAGSEVVSRFTSPAGDPTAYQVRGALVALREEQARLIRVEPLAEGTA